MWGESDIASFFLSSVDLIYPWKDLSLDYFFQVKQAHSQVKVWG